jgi:hypothetical protein
VQSMRQVAAGGLYVVTALITGYRALPLVFAPSGGLFFWWPLVMFGASILLMVGGTQTLAPRMKQRWSVAIAAAVPLIMWIAFLREFLWIFWIFAVTVTLLTWGILALASALNRNWIAGFAASLILAVSWLPISVEALVEYFSPKPPASDPTALLWLVTPNALALVSLVAGIVLCKSPTSGASSAGGGGFEHSAEDIRAPQ